MGKGKREVQVTREKASQKAESRTPKFYEFSQNNSGGRFHETEDLAEYVIIEAYSPDHANQRALEFGIYFDGRGDCSCCGNRWHEQYSYGKDPGNEMPTVYGEPVKTFLEKPGYGFRSKAIVHYLDGTRETYQAIEND